MTIGSKIAGSLLENFMKSYKFADNKLTVVNEKLHQQARDQIAEMLDNTTRDWWIQLESSEGSLAKMADEIDFEQKEGNPTKLSNKVTKTDDKKAEDEGEEVTESFDFNSIFSEGDVHVHNYPSSGEYWAGNDPVPPLDDSSSNGLGAGTEGEVEEDSFTLGSGNQGMGSDISGGLDRVSPALTTDSPSSAAAAGNMGDGNDATSAIASGSRPAANDGSSGFDNINTESEDDYEFDLSFLEEPEDSDENHDAFGGEPEGEENPESKEPEAGEEKPEDDEDDIEGISFDEPKGKEKGTEIEFGKGHEGE